LKSKYVTLDTDALYGLFKDLSVFKKYKSAKEFGSAQAEVFTQLFRIPKRLLHHDPDRKLFNFMIKTDGVGASVVVARWKEKDTEIMNAETKEDKAVIYRERAETKRKMELEELKRKI
jgi:hypothetical protein